MAERDGLSLADSYAYSDSMTDRPMLEAVGHPVVVNPDKELRELAEKRDWQVMEFANPISLRSRLAELPAPDPVVSGVVAGTRRRSRRVSRCSSTAASMTETFTESGRMVLSDIAPRAWEHPSDRAALAALRKVPGFDLVLKKLFGMVGERSLRLFHHANAVQVGEHQFGRLHERYMECCAVLDIETIPELYVAQTPLLNAANHRSRSPIHRLRFLHSRDPR